MTVLNTDFLVSLLRGEPAASEKSKEISGPKTTMINAFELLYGAEKSARRDTALGEVNALLESLEILDLDMLGCREAARIEAELSKRGRLMGISDVLIAGIVLAQKENLLTRNVDHFANIHGLKLQTW